MKLFFVLFISFGLLHSAHASTFKCLINLTGEALFNHRNIMLEIEQSDEKKAYLGRGDEGVSNAVLDSRSEQGFVVAKNFYFEDFYKRSMSMIHEISALLEKEIIVGFSVVQLLGSDDKSSTTYLKYEDGETLGNLFMKMKEDNPQLLQKILVEFSRRVDQTAQNLKALDDPRYSIEHKTVAHGNISFSTLSVVINDNPPYVFSMFDFNITNIMLTRDGFVIIDPI